MTDAPSKVAEAIAIARRTLRIVWQNIIGESNSGEVSLVRSIYFS